MRPGAASRPRILKKTQEAFFVLQGTLQLTAGNRTLTVPPGGFLTVGEGAVRHYVNAGSEPLELLTWVAPAGFDELQFRSGYPIGSEQESPPAATDDDRELSRILGGSYGVDLSPVGGDYQQTPKLRLSLPNEGAMHRIGNEHYQLLAVSDNTAGQFMACRLSLPPGEGSQPHIHHREDEAIYLLSGSLAVHADGIDRQLTRGHFAYLPAEVPHAVTNNGDELAECLLLTAPGGWNGCFSGWATKNCCALRKPPPRSRVLKRAEWELAGNSFRVWPRILESTYSSRNESIRQEPDSRQRMFR